MRKPPHGGYPSAYPTSLSPTVEGSLRSAVKQGLPGLCVMAGTGSSWAALLIAIETKPNDLAELMRVIGMPRTGKYREAAFNAAADAYAMYLDGLANGAEL